jgi:uroporphyrin-III C-methyltransferase
VSLLDAVSRLTLDTPKFEPGHVWLAGAGPGNLANLTLGVVKALCEADAIVYDALVDPSVLDAAANAETHFVGKRAGQPSTSQATINALLVRLAREGKRVLRLKGGDPNVFGRGAEEAGVLAAANIPFRFLSGVTSAFGALASVGIPATLRGVNKAIILATGHGSDMAPDLDWSALARTGQPIVVYMGVGHLAAITQALMQAGLPHTTAAAAIMSATLPGERMVVATLGTIEARAREERIASPALIVIGEIVNHRFAQGAALLEEIEA